MLSRIGLFAKRPSVSHEDGRIVIRNSMVTRVLNFGTHLRRVELDPVSRTVKYSSRCFWLFDTRLEVAFDDLSHLTCLSGSLETGYSNAAEGVDTGENDHEFSLALVTTAADMVEIGTYAGGLDEARGNLLGKSSPAAELIDQLRNLLSIQLETGKRKRGGLFTRCPGCGRRISRFAIKCIYCKKTGQ